MECYTCPKLESGTEYDVYIVAEDDGGHACPPPRTSTTSTSRRHPRRARRRRAALAAPVVTADVTAPSWTNDAPYATNFTATGSNAVALDEPGVVHYAVVVVNTTCSDADTYATVSAGTDGCG